MHSSQRAGLILMCEGTLQKLSAPPQQTLAPLAFHAPLVGVHRGLLARLCPSNCAVVVEEPKRNSARPSRACSPNSRRCDSPCPSPLRTCPCSCTLYCALRGRRGDLLGHRQSGRRQGLLDRCRVPHRAALRGDRHDRARVQIHRLLGFVGQVRRAILHLGHFGVPDRADSPTPHWTSSSSACDPCAAPRRRRWSRCPPPSPAAADIPCNSRRCPAAQSSASPHWLPAWSRRSRWFCPSAFRAAPLPSTQT